MQQIHFLLLYPLKHPHIANLISSNPVWPSTHMFKHTLNKALSRTSFHRELLLRNNINSIIKISLLVGGRKSKKLAK